MIPVILGAIAVGVLVSSCKSEEEKEGPELSPQRPSSDPVNQLPFIQTGVGSYWADLDVDGKQTTEETVFVREGQDRNKQAQGFIDRNAWALSACFQWKPRFLPGTRQDYFEHPLKNRMDQQLSSDITKLKEMKGRLPIYDRLLQDLENITKELPFVQFRYPTAEEIKEFSNNQGYLGLYNNMTNEIVAPRNMPMSLLVHEMDHRVTAHHRIEPWGVSYQERCGDSGLRKVPKAPHLPSPDHARTHFDFSLDFFGNGQNKLTYNDLDYWSAVYRSFELGAQACFSSEAKHSTLANEVRAYQTMGRYLLFKINFTHQDLAAIRGQDTGPKQKAKQKLLIGLRKELDGSSLNPEWTNELMLHYLGIGGSSEEENLSTFVANYYSNVIQDPGFVDPPDCVK